jgi:hypothetical protein
MTESDERTQGLDPDLVGLVQLADAYGLEYDLVLTLAGQVVQGTLVSARSFSSEIADAVQGEDPDGTLRSSMATRFRRRAERLEEFGAASKLGDLDPDGPEGDDLPVLPDVEFVHLRDASVSGVTGRLSLWRGRLDAVTGWTLGGFVAAD